MTKLLSIVLVLATAGTACAATQSHSSAPRQLRVPLQIGSVVPELLDPSLQDLTIGLMKQANLADVGRITVTWQKGQTAMDPGQLGDLRTAVDKATAAGIGVYLDVYPNGSSQTPNSAADQADFATWAASIVAGLPDVKHVIVGNESNLNLFWLPQFGSADRTWPPPGTPSCWRRPTTRSRRSRRQSKWSAAHSHTPAPTSARAPGRPIRRRSLSSTWAWRTAR